MYNILLIEDDTALNKAISVYFKKKNFMYSLVLVVKKHLTHFLKIIVILLF